jgi:hypothetical protein
VDSRITLAVLLPAGIEVLAEATTQINRIFEDLGVSTRELDRVVGLLNAFRRGAGDHTEL